MTQRNSNKEFSKYLGIYIAENLSWYKHIQMTINKISKNIGHIENNVPLFARKYILYILYFSLIKPYTEYSNLAWGGAAKTNLAKINRSLRKAIRIMMFRGKMETVQSLCQYFNILPLNLNKKCAKFMHKLVFKKIL